MRTRLLTSTSLFSLALFATACGGPSGGGNDAPAPKKLEPTPLANETYALALAEGGLRTVTSGGEPVRFTWNLSVDGAQASNGQSKLHSELVQALRDVKVHGDSQLDFTLSLSDAAGKLLATNVDTLAKADPINDKIWSEGCGSVSPRSSVREHATVVLDAGKKLLALDLPLCDFAKVLVAPTMTITPANYTVERRDAIFECIGAIDNDFFSLSYLLYIDRPQCRLAYTAPGAEAVRTEDLTKGKTFSAPENMDAAKVTIDTYAQLLQFETAQPKARRYLLGNDIGLHRASFGELPFGKTTDCWGLEVEAMYKDDAAAAAGATKEARLTWRRGLDGNGKLVWIAADQTAMPEPAQVKAAAQSSAKFWLFCSWENATGVSLAPQPTL